jgi:glucose uptake protein GlcU
MSAAKQQPTIRAVSTVAVSTAVPLLIDIKAAAQMLGTSVFAVRVLCWDSKTAHILRPVRHGLQFLFAPAALVELRDALVAGTVTFPRSPSKPKRKAGRS